MVIYYDDNYAIICKWLTDNYLYTENISMTFAKIIQNSYTIMHAR